MTDSGAYLDDPVFLAALAVAAALPDVDGLAAGSRLRRDFAPEVAATALTQVGLRRRARTKFGSAADTLFFTRDGLEQATRPAVAAHRAARFVAGGVGHVVDLGCGIGTDALALLAAGLQVTAVEADPATAAVARANLEPHGGTVITGDAVALAADLLTDPTTAAFCDPARRTAAGRTWRPDDVSPPWAFVTGLLDGTRTAGVKAGPGLPYRFIPNGVDAEWVSDDGDVVEVSLWAPGSGARRATLLPAGAELTATATVPLPVSPPGSYVFEPDGAAIRAGAVDTLGATYGLGRLDPQIAYLTGDAAVDSPWLTGFAVTEVLPYAEKALRGWVRERKIGTLEIKKRGVDVDPALLRRRLRPSGSEAATLIVTPTAGGTRVLVVQRVVGPERAR